jgi:8-oxo-dGTP pyrophosphatase MutT (NUDIX family)
VNLSLARIIERLAGTLDGTPADGNRRAAVAVVLRAGEAGPDVLLMERAVREGDRWSGQISFPGGREEEHDESLVATAMRETREEVGLDLARGARPIGVLEPMRAIARGKILPMTITPFVFHLAEPPGELVLNHEAVATFWLPLADAARGAFDGEYEYKLGPVKMRFPCWIYEGRSVWGLTYQMLRQLLTRVG